MLSHDGDHKMAPVGLVGLGTWDKGWVFPDRDVSGCGRIEKEGRTDVDAKRRTTKANRLFTK